MINLNSFGFSQEELDFIESYDKKSHEIWNSTEGLIVEIRRKIRRFFLARQGYQCPYCRQIKREDHGLTWDIDHILPKSIYPKFLFEPLNLAASCKECNSKKDNYDTLAKRKARATYPESGDDISIIHPHFDVYKNHMDVLNINGKIIFRPKDSGKGRNTYIACDLIRFCYSYADWKDFGDEICDLIIEAVDDLPAESLAEDLKILVPRMRKYLKRT